MQVSLQLSVWLNGSVARNFALPAPREFLAAGLLRRLARRPDYQEILERAKLPPDFMDGPIDEFVAGLKGDCDHSHTVTTPLLRGMADDVRVTIRSKSTRSCRSESAWIRNLLATAPKPKPMRGYITEDGKIVEVADER